MKITAVQKSLEITALLSVPNSRIIAGGTTFRAQEDDSVHGVDISGLEGFDYICQRGPRLEIGPLATLADIASSLEAKIFSQALVEAAETAGDEQLRAKGTLGGNLASVPIGDLALPLLAANAVVTVKTDCDYRKINLDHFYKTNGGNVLRYDEWLTRVSFMGTERPASGSAFARARKWWNEKSCPLAAAVQLERDPEGTITRIRGAVRPTEKLVQRMFPLEKLLKNRNPDESLLEKAAAAEARALKDWYESESQTTALLLDILHRALAMSDLREVE